MPDSTQYKNLINEIIQKQIAILGPDIVKIKAQNVSGLKLDESGEVVSLDSDPQQILQSLIDEYIGLSGQIVKNILNPVLAKYPEIKISI